MPAPAGVGARPVIGSGRAAVALLPGAHRLAYLFVRPLGCDGAGMACLAGGVSVGLAVAGLCGRAAALAYPLVAALDGSGFLASRVVSA